MTLNQDIEQKRLIDGLAKKNFTLPRNSEIFLSPVRLNVMLLLFTYRKVLFTELLKLLALTPGNLDYHLNVLEKAGFIIKKRAFSVTRFKIFVEITKEGVVAFKTLLTELKSLIEKIEEHK